ncbi:hypothetical protein HYH02_011150 [Chlamydomonas schloesseri]|uniref:Nudix hydrolase domain-containing protein n=1 Tax=Chlamydomonas schloesseri TaxID=2026947 RepID=A0A835TFG2_9CHLO|nr:hypothetical protein HYH02_011150 [Chlamydomonas schloesseri]|eukprot:KAG2437775.1 hypothetical protein HYH02_011150 [Chlamydomonas schloesseri]
MSAPSAEVAAGTPRSQAGGNAGAAVHVPAEHPWHNRFEVKEDRAVHKRYMTMFDRTVEFTSESGQTQTVQYDVVGHPQCSFVSAVAFPFHPATSTSPAQVTLVREYAQGPNALMYTLPCGGFEPKRHANLRECAVAEMREEAMLVGGEVVDLLPEDHPGQSELKWSRNRFKPFLFIDPQPDTSGHAERDAEEHTIQVMRVTIPELHDIIRTGQLMMLSVYAAFLSLEVLRERKLI